MKIIIRHALYIEDNGRLNPCGSRLIKDAQPPRVLQAENGSLIFHFDNPDTAKAAAVALENYLAVQEKEKK